MPTNEVCLFSAPADFLGELKGQFLQKMPTKFIEVWDELDIPSDAHFSTWIVNPGQRFIVDRHVLNKFPVLKLIITPSTGQNHINIKDCEDANIKVLSLLDDRQTLDTIRASSEFTFLAILMALRNIRYAFDEVGAGRWRHNEENLRGRELIGKRVGIVGFGRIGQNIARWSECFDAEVNYFDPHVEIREDLKLETLDQIFSESDVVCVCCTYVESTHGLIRKKQLTSMRSNAVLINTSRGEVIDEDDLVQFARERPDVAVGLDVLSGEVTDTHFESPLINMHRNGRLFVTPHIAGATVESQSKAASAALSLLKLHAP